jgi:hypothetical protein
MPNCDFYALAQDSARVLEFIFAQPGWVLYELASRPDQTTRVFRSTGAVLEAFRVGEIETHFQLYAPEMRGRVLHTRIDFRPGAVPGASHRFATEGWGLIQVYFGALKKEGTLTPSHTNHNRHTRANAWAPHTPALGDPDDWDWPAVVRTSGRLVRFIKRISAGKEGSRPVLPSAHAAIAEGRVRICAT